MTTSGGPITLLLVDLLLDLLGILVAFAVAGVFIRWLRGRYQGVPVDELDAFDRDQW